ncbi:MAG: hypothetical protein ABJL58_03140 [Nitratireductor sp.]
MLERLFQNARRQKARILGKGGEKNAVEHGLRRGDRLERIEPGQLLANGENQRAAQRLVVGVKRVGDVLVFAAALPEERHGLAGEKVFRRKKKPEAGILGRHGQLRQVEPFIGLCPRAEAVESDFQIVGNQHPFHARRAGGLFPGLLNRAFGAPGHDRVEIDRFCALQFERCDNLRFLLGEMTERQIDGAAQDGLFGSHGEGFVLDRPLIAQHRFHDMGLELGVQLDFLVIEYAPRFDQPGPALKALQMVGRNLAGIFEMTGKRFRIEQVHCAIKPAPCVPNMVPPRSHSAIWISHRPLIPQLDQLQSTREIGDWNSQYTPFGLGQPWCGRASEIRTMPAEMRKIVAGLEKHVASRVWATFLALPRASRPDFAMASALALC